MSDTPRAEPNEKATAPGAEAASDSRAKRDLYLDLATDIAPQGKLRRFVLREPAWCRRIGQDVIYGFCNLDPSEIQLLFDAHARSVKRRDEEKQARQDIEKWFAWLPKSRPPRRMRRQ